MVDAARLAVRIDQQIFRAVHEAQRRRHRACRRPARLARAVRRRNRPRERRLVAEGAGRIDRAEQQLQQVQRAAGVEAVAVRADAAHRVHRHRPADHLACSRPQLSVQAIGSVSLTVEGGCGQFARDAADGVGRNAAAFG